MGRSAAGDLACVVGTVNGRSCADGSLPADRAESAASIGSDVALSISEGRFASSAAVVRSGAGSCCGRSLAAADGELVGRDSAAGSPIGAEGVGGEPSAEVWTGGEFVDEDSTDGESTGEGSVAAGSAGGDPVGEESDAESSAGGDTAGEESDAEKSAVRRV